MKSQLWSLLTAAGRGLISGVSTPGCLRSGCLAMGIFLFLGSPVVAQNTVSGRVVSAGAQDPIAGAQVILEGTDRTTLTDAEGRFTFNNVTGAEVVIQVQRIGFRSVRVRRAGVGGPAFRIVLTALAINLDQIVVTGTAGAVQKRSLGNTLATIDVENLQTIAPVSTMQQMLQGRAAGVVMQPASGMVGSGGRIRIRGVNSLSLQNEPLIYVDGVRVDNSLRTGIGGGPFQNGYWQAMSRFNDLNMEEVESIEIIKGPAAATLYGTEASNGVIQIITKKGRVGRPRVNLSVQQGVNFVADPEGRFPTYYLRRTDGTLQSTSIVADESSRGRHLFQNGHVQRYSLNVSGGTESAQYYVSGGYENEVGVFAPNEGQRLRLQGNVTSHVSEKLDIGLNLSYQTGRTDLNQEGSGPLGSVWFPCGSELCIDEDGFQIWDRPGVVAPEVSQQVQSFFENLDRFIGGVQINFRPWSWFTHKLTIGVDQVVQDQNLIFERNNDPQIQAAFGSLADGARTILSSQTSTNTVDYSATVGFDLTSAIGSQTSVGLQYYRQFIEFQNLFGLGFPAPGVSALSATATRTSSGSFGENITLGSYVQQTFSLNNRLFITGAVRADDNSAFGQDFNLVTYPKFSLAWVASEESFWPLPFVNSFRVRGAYGESGKQPVNFAALRVFQPMTAPGDVPGVRPQALGNDALGPERGQEIEVGFESSLFNDRVSIDFTYYDKKTNDVILNRGVAPSLGFPGSQPVNIGQVTNRGIELLLRGVPVATENVTLDLGLNLSTNKNRITDMGDLPTIGAGATQRHREGFPVAAFFGRQVLSADVSEDASGNIVITNVMCDGGIGAGTGTETLNATPGGDPVPCAGAPDVFLGGPTPTLEGAFTTNLILFNRLTLYGLVDFQTGHLWFDWTNTAQCAAQKKCGINHLAELAMADPVLAGAFSLPGINHQGVHPDRSFARLRQLSASYEFPQSLAQRFGAGSLNFTLSARNLWLLWTRGYEGVEPDVGTVSQGGLGTYYINFIPTPQAVQLTASLRVGF